MTTTTNETRQKADLDYMLQQASLSEWRYGTVTVYEPKETPHSRVQRIVLASPNAKGEEERISYSLWKNEIDLYADSLARINGEEGWVHLFGRHTYYYGEELEQSGIEAKGFGFHCYPGEEGLCQEIEHHQLWLYGVVLVKPTQQTAKGKLYRRITLGVDCYPLPGSYDEAGDARTAWITCTLWDKQCERDSEQFVGFDHMRGWVRVTGLKSRVHNDTTYLEVTKMEIADTTFFLVDPAWQPGHGNTSSTSLPRSAAETAETAKTAVSINSSSSDSWDDPELDDLDI
jgi:hypothetical protein